VIAISQRTFGQRAVFKFAQHTGAGYIAGRYTPGTFTNQINRFFKEPRLLVVTDPHVDHQPVLEVGNATAFGATAFVTFIGVMQLLLSRSLMRLILSRSFSFSVPCATAFVTCIGDDYLCSLYY
jgi:hypothetical protein